MKMKPCSKGQPKDGEYLAQLQHIFEDGDVINYYTVLECVEGHWNCGRSNITGEILRDNEMYNVVAWCELPEFYKGENDDRGMDI